MAVEYNILHYTEGTQSLCCYATWMKNFIYYVEQQYEDDTAPYLGIWCHTVADELKKYSAYLIHSTETTVAKIHFEDEQLATLFFLKFSES